MWICGDAHIANFGVFATFERALAFDMNDFDETTLGPWEWDLKRFATSLVLSGRQAGRPAESINDAVKRAVQSYIAETHRLSRLSALECWYEHLDAGKIEDTAGRNDRVCVTRLDAPARMHTSLDLFPELTRRERRRRTANRRAAPANNAR